MNQTPCCRYCGKMYVKKTNLEKHIVLCEFIRKSSNVPKEEEEPPSQRKMYQILLELGYKYHQLEQRLNEMDKWVVKKKKKINIIEWLNHSIVPESKFSTLNELIYVQEDDISYLFKHTFADTLDRMFERTIYATRSETETRYPLVAFTQNNHKLYMYENAESGWMECSKEELCKFLNKVHLKLHRTFMNWKKENAVQIANDEDLSLLCDKTSIKMLSVDFRQESIFHKIKANMYSSMKKDIKGIVEYEFEF